MSNKIEIMLVPRGEIAFTTASDETVAFATDRPTARYFGRVEGDGCLSIYLQEAYAFGINEHRVASYAPARWLQWTEVG